MGDVGQIGAAGINAASDLAVSAATNAANAKMNKNTNEYNVFVSARQGFRNKMKK